jgi:conserved oligomeric Golgi complex subunit 3
VFAAVTALRSGCDGVSKNSSSPLHGDLFMVRHLLILREQLIPFDIRLQGSEKALDFQSTSAAFSYFTSHGRDLLRFDNDNG